METFFLQTTILSFIDSKWISCQVNAQILNRKDMHIIVSNLIFFKFGS